MQTNGKSMKLKKILCFFLLLALLPVCGIAEETGLDERVDQIFRDAKTVGGAFLVAQRGEIVYERYYGVQQKTTRVPVTEKSYFRCASVTKLVTGIGLLKMMDDGLLDPDEDISAYLGYAVGNPRYPDTPVTLRMLMSHTAGLNENSSYSSMASTLSDMIALDHKAAANFKEVRPGSQYAYSNFGAGITGSVIESVTGQDVSSFMREYLFAPLGIDAAYTATQLEDAEEYLTATYNQDGTLYRAPSYILRQPYDAFATPDTHYRVTVGSLLIRPRDLTRLGIAICGDGTLDGVRVLSEEAIAMMRQEQSPETTGITGDTPYSFFTIRQDTLLDGRRVYGHQGTDEGIVCNLYVEPVSQTVFCVMTNGCKTTREDGIMRISRRLCAAAADVFLTE